MFGNMFKNNDDDDDDEKIAMVVEDNVMSRSEELENKFKNNIWFNAAEQKYCYFIASPGDGWEKLNLNHKEKNVKASMSYYTHHALGNINHLILLEQDSFDVWKAIEDTFSNIEFLDIHVYLLGGTPGIRYLNEFNGIQNLKLTFQVNNLVLYSNNSNSRHNKSNHVTPENLNTIGANVNSTLCVNVFGLKSFLLHCSNPSTGLRVEVIDFIQNQEKDAVIQLNNLGDRFTISNMSQTQYFTRNATTMERVFKLANDAKMADIKTLFTAAIIIRANYDISSMATSFRPPEIVDIKSTISGTHLKKIIASKLKTELLRKKKLLRQNLEKIKERADTKASATPNTITTAKGFKKRKPKKTLKKRKSRK